MKYVEYTLKAGKKTLAHGVCLKNRLEFALTDEGTLTATMLEDDAAQALIDKWGGVMVEPAAAEPVA